MKEDIMEKIKNNDIEVESKTTVFFTLKPPTIHMRDYYDFLDGKKMHKCSKCGRYYRHCAECGKVISGKVYTYWTLDDYCPDHYCKCILKKEIKKIRKIIQVS